MTIGFFVVAEMICLAEMITAIPISAFFASSPDAEMR